MKLILLSLVVTLSFCRNSPTSSQPDAKLEKKVDNLVQSYVDSKKAAGVAVAVYRGNEKLLLKSYGYADLELDVPMPVNASFEIGSVTKQFTAAAILQLVEQGKLSLADDLTKYIHFNTQGKKVTILQLLTHTSGIKSYTEMPMFENLAMRKYQRDTLLRIIEKEPFDFNPGEALIYNNTAFFMLGLIIEKITGITYEDYVKKNLFDKAGMNNSYYCSESKITKNRAHGYDMGEKGLVLAGYIDQTWPFSAGSLCSTVEDLIKWNDALHHGKILSDKMYKELISPAVLNDGTITHYAKGITVTNLNGRKMIEHGGGIPGFLSESRYYPTENLTIVVLVNTTGPVAPGEIADNIDNYISGSSKKELHFFKGDLSKFSGTYKGRGRGEDLAVKVMNNDSTLSVQFGDDKSKPLYYNTDDSWTDATSGSRISTYIFKQADTSSELRIDQVYGYYILKKE